MPTPHSAEIICDVLVECLLDWNVHRKLSTKNGLLTISKSIEKTRDSVTFWVATPKREEKFKDTCTQLSIIYGKKLALECITRWNSTFLRLVFALPYQEAFKHLKQCDPQYKCFPSEEDWEFADEICDKLEIFFSV